MCRQSFVIELRDDSEDESTDMTPLLEEVLNELPDDVSYVLTELDEYLETP